MYLLALEQKPRFCHRANRQCDSLIFAALICVLEAALTMQMPKLVAQSQIGKIFSAALFFVLSQQCLEKPFEFSGGVYVSCSHYNANYRLSPNQHGGK